MSKIVGELNAEIMKKVIHDRRAKLFAEIVAKTGSKQSVIDRAMQEIESLREQVEKDRKDAWQMQADFNAAIWHALSLGVDGLDFLRYWNEGDWDACAQFGFTPSEALRNPCAMQERG